MSKTNAARILDQLKIQYELREYEVDPEDLAAETVAAKIGMPSEQVFKTLVVRGERRGVALAVVPGCYELDFKALAQLLSGYTQFSIGTVEGLSLQVHGIRRQ